MALAALATGAAGCSAQCEAACLSSVTARGPLSAAPATTVRLRFCVDGSCSECETVLQEGDVSCDDVIGTLTGDQLELWRDVFDDPQIGQLVEVSVTAVDSGEVLAEVRQAIEATTESEVCEQTCRSATVAWHDGDA